MVPAAALWLLGSGALLWAALLVHTRLRGFLPEDPPGPGRKRHPRPTPMAGGAPAALAAALLATSGEGWSAAAVAIAGVTGLADDVRKEHGTGVAWKTKAAALLVASLCGALGLSDVLEATWTGWFAVVVALFVLTNATNFLDNQDGVATGLGVTALLLVGGLDLDDIATRAAGVWLAFLPFNWPRARMFLGDSGALALGACVGVLVLRGAAGSNGVEVLAAAAPVAVLLLDFAQVVTARLALGYAPWIADRRHITHVMLAHGVPRAAIAPALTAIAVAIGLLAR